MGTFHRVSRLGKIILLISILFLLLMGGCVSATEIWIPSGAQAGTYYLSSANAIYHLSGDIVADKYAFSVTANNVTLDGTNNVTGDPFNVTYAQSAVGYGISSYNYHDIKIQNINFIQNKTSVAFAHCVLFQGTSDSTVENITGNTTGGGRIIYVVSPSHDNIFTNINGYAENAISIYFANTNNNTLNSVNVISTVKQAAYFATANNTTINGGTYQSDSNGILLTPLTNSILTGVTAISTGPTAGLFIAAGSTGNTLTNCKGSSSVNHGIDIRSGPNTLIDSYGYSTNGYGGFLYHVSNITSINCSFKSVSNQGLQLSSSTYNNFTNCNFSSLSSHGLYLTNSNYNNITNSTGNSSSQAGALISSSHFSHLSHSTFSSISYYGLNVLSSNGCTISSDICSSVSSIGATFTISNNSRVSNCDFHSVNSYGLLYTDCSNGNFTNCTVKSTLNNAICLRDLSNDVFSWLSVASPLCNAPISTKHMLSIGDSITAGGAGANGRMMGAWTPYANNTLNSISSSWTVSNQGVSGETAQEGGTRFTQELSIFNPDVVTIWYGVNDLGQGRSQQAIINDILNMANLSIASGAVPYIILTVPHQVSATNTAIIYLDRNLSSQANLLGIKTVNAYDMIDTSPFNGIYDSYSASTSVDGTHPNNATNVILGVHITQQILDSIANFSASSLSGVAPLSAHFTELPNNSTAWAWDFENDGIIDTTLQNPVHTYGKAGNYSVNLTVRTEYGNFSAVKNNYITVTAAPTWTQSAIWWILHKFGFMLTILEDS